MTESILPLNETDKLEISARARQIIKLHHLVASRHLTFEDSLALSNALAMLEYELGKWKALDAYLDD
jgi:hypothetical protein